MLTADRARELLDYDPDTGTLTWIESPRGGHVKVGDVAGTVARTGYLVVTFKGKKYKAHRIIWLMVTGDWPPDMVDHINRDKLDNRWANLRAVTNSENLRNARRKVSASSGVMGVTLSKVTSSSGKVNKYWVASIASEANMRVRKYFKCRDKAIAWRREMERRHGYL